MCLGTYFMYMEGIKFFVYKLPSEAIVSLRAVFKQVFGLIEKFMST
jgi:hypothetical protein